MTHIRSGPHCRRQDNCHKGKWLHLEQYLHHTTEDPNYRNYSTTSKTAYCSNMKFFIFVSAIVLTFLAIFGVAADQPMKQIIISYPKGTPASVLEEAKKYVLDAGGFIS